MSTQDVDRYTWQMAEVLANRRALFVLWAVKTLFCTTKADFLHHYKITEDELNFLLENLTVQGFLQQDDEHYVLTELGNETVKKLKKLHVSQFARLERPNRAVLDRFGQSEAPAGIPDTITAQDVANRFWQDREYDRDSPEAKLVELPCIQQLVGLGWHYQAGDTGAPEITRRHSFSEILIEEILREYLPKINPIEGSDEPWLDEPRIEQAIDTLKRCFTRYSPSLLQTNESATERLLAGADVQGTPELHNNKIQSVHYIDFVHPENNHFLVINQFRVDLAGTRYIVPDIVLFVNGIPLVVIECKNPALTNPVEEGISQLLRYARQNVAVVMEEQDEAAPELFYFNLLLISTCFFQARFATLGSSYEHFREWKTSYPLSEGQLAQRLQTEHVSSQQMLVQGMLLPQTLLDLLYNFTLFKPSGTRKIKLVAYYHQFRAVQEAVKRLEKNPTRARHGEDDQRGGIIWHTQGSGKSLTMTFLVRKMRTMRKLRNFKIVFVTDRKELQKQLRDTAYLTQETPETVSLVRELEPLLKPEGPNLIFAMIQKYQRRKTATTYLESEDEDDASDDEATDQDDEADPGVQKINEQENILVIVDEAHRSQTRKLHANLKKMLPNCARIAFTGTPIIRGRSKKTRDIFGDFIDEYNIKQSELDGATLPIFYEGREAYIDITQRELLDIHYEQITRPLSRLIRESLAERHETYRQILEAPRLIEVKAWDMLLHYATNVLPNGFKAMVVAVSRLAAIRYCDALEAANKKLLERLNELTPEQRELPEEELKHLDPDDELTLLMRIYPLRDTLRQLQFAAVVSPGPKDHEDDRVDWSKWTDEQRNEDAIANFKKPLPHGGNLTESNESSPLAFLCVRSMLITGFDAPIVQALYLDRSIKDHELLQAIARVNRVHSDKTCGIVVDYFGVANNLKEALSAYEEKQIQGALVSIKDEIPLLDDRHRRVMALFEAAKCSIQDVERCVNLLKDTKIRADFEIKFKKFMESMDIILPREYALRYIDDAQQLGLINKAASAVYRDDQLNLINVGNKVRKLIDEHIDALKIRQLIERISIHDTNFEHKLKRHQSDETRAADMESFARAYIEHKFAQEDPAYYNKLSERLDAIIHALHDNWSQRVADLEEFIQIITKPRTIDKTNLDPRTERPFLGILEEEVRKGSTRFGIAPNEGTGRKLEDDELFQLADLTRQIVQLIRQELVGNNDYWFIAENREILRRRIGRMLEVEGRRLLDPFTRREAVALRLTNLARALTPQLRNE